MICLEAKSRAILKQRGLKKLIWTPLQQNMNTYSLSIPGSLGIFLVITITTVPENNDKTHTHTHKEDLSFQLYTNLLCNNHR